MTLEIFILGITICSAFTALVTEAVKKMFEKTEKPYNSNLIAAVCSIIVAAITVVVYAILSGIAVTTQFVTLAILLIIFSWLGAMVGYDKVIQTIKQLTTKENK